MGGLSMCQLDAAGVERVASPGAGAVSGRIRVWLRVPMNRGFRRRGWHSDADAYLFVVVNWSRVTAVDLTAFPGVQRFQARIMSRPAVQAAMKAEGLMK